MKKHLLAALAALAIVGGAVLLLLAANGAFAQTIGSVDTAFKLLGANHKVEVLAFDDPKVENSTCYLSRPVAGGLGGAIGLAEEKSDVSIACRAVGPLRIKTDLGANEQVFDERRSPLFKKLRVVRMWDPARKVIVYLAYSDKLIDGSPKNSISVVPMGASL